MIDFSFFSRLVSSHWYFREWLGIDFAWESECYVQNIYSYPVPCANDLSIINWGSLRRSIFPAKSLHAWLNCQKMSHKTTSPSVSGFFIYCFLSQDRSMVATRLDQCTAYQRLDRGGVDYCFDNLVKYNISAFFLALRTCTFLWHPSCRIAGLLRFP